MKLNDRGMFRLEDRVLFEAAYEKDIYIVLPVSIAIIIACLTEKISTSVHTEYPNLNMRLIDE